MTPKYEYARGWFGVAAVLAALCVLAVSMGQASLAFKLGTFERSGQTFVGMVLGDARVIDIAQANAAFEAGNASARKLAAPGDMKQLIAR